MSRQSALCQMRWASWSAVVIFFKDSKLPGEQKGLLSRLEGHQSASPPPPARLSLFIIKAIIAFLSIKRHEHTLDKDAPVLLRHRKSVWKLL